MPAPSVTEVAMVVLVVVSMMATVALPTTSATVAAVWRSPSSMARRPRSTVSRRWIVVVSP
ncbi:hypothetical protein D3C86_1287730 [compost metagenome]